MIDSGAKGNFIHVQQVERLQIPVQKLHSSLKVATLDGEPVGLGTITNITTPLTVQTSALHQEELSFLVLEHSEFEVILGLPWLEKHNPNLSWAEHTIAKWSDYCVRNCLTVPTISVLSTSIESPHSDSPFEIPPEYVDLKEVFNKKNAPKLPPHTPYDCAIDLIENPVLPKTRVYPLPQAEQHALDVSTEERRVGKAGRRLGTLRWSPY